MKYGVIVLTVMLFLGGSLAAAGTPTDTPATDLPKVVFSHVKYEFDKVVDGTTVTCDFPVKNAGQGILEIGRVKTG